MIHKFFLSFTLVLSCLAHLDNYDPDFNKPINLAGIFLGLNFNSGIGIYKGNFIAIQRSIKIEGAEIHLKQTKNNELDNSCNRKAY